MKARTRFVSFATLFVTTALAGSYFLMPSKQEIALGSYKDKSYAEALKLYEEQYAAGSLTVDTVSTLAKVYLQYAKIDEAITVMEKFVEQNPTNLEARQELGRLYQYGQRPDDYVRNLEEMNKLAESSERLKELVQTYKATGADAKVIPLMVKRIIEEKQGSAKEHRELANMLASAKRYEEALHVLGLMRSKYPDKIRFSDHELTLRLYAELGEKEKARDYATGLLKEKLASEEVARVATILLYLVSPEAAYAYITQVDEALLQEDAVFAQYIVILQAVNKKEDAYQLAKTRYAEGKLAEGLHDELMVLAFNVGNQELVAQLRDELNYDALSAEDVLGLLDVALNTKDAVLLGKLQERGEAIISSTQDSYLQVMLLLASNRTERETDVVTVMEAEEALPRRLALAQLCALRKVQSCVDAFFKGLPPYEEMNDSEIVAVARVLQAAGRAQEAYELVDAARASRDGVALQQVWFPLAASYGTAEVVQPYLNEDAPLDTKTYQDAYYAAMNNKSYGNAALIAEYLYGKDQSGLHRNFVAQSYLVAGDYTHALPLVRENKGESAQAEQDYLFVLSKLAKTDNEAAKELRDYALGVLNNNPSKVRREQMIGALISGGQQGAVMPYIKELALTNPKEWAYVYADYLQKTAGREQVAAFWRDVAVRHSGNIELRRQIAYTLLENGDKVGATQMFMALCVDTHAKPDDAMVKELLYLWSPIYPPEGVAWLLERANNATDAHTKRGWLLHASNGVSDEGLVALMDQQPSLQDIPTLEARYLSVITKKDEKQGAAYLKEHIANTQDVAALLRYARFAEENMMPALSEQAYAKAVEVAPQNALALGKAGVQAANNAYYTKAKTLLDRYFALDLPSLPNSAEAYRPHFHYAELLKREGNLQEANHYYQKVVKAAQAAPQDKELQSMAARSLASLGAVPEAIEKFTELQKTYPQDRQLKADYSAMLVEAGQREKAAASLPAWREASVAPATNFTPTSLSALGASGYSLVDDGEKVMLQHGAGFNAKEAEALPWVAYVIEGRDSSLLVAKENVSVQVMAGTNGEVWLHPEAEQTNYATRQDTQYVVQNELINARIQVETGEGYAASERTRALVKNHPQNAQVLGFAANVENFNGNWPYARRLINQAHDLQPHNEDIIALQRGIERQHGANIYLDGAWRALGENNEYIGSLGASYDVDDTRQIGIELQHNAVRSDTLRLSDGRIGQFDDEKQRGEAYFRYFGEEGDMSQISLFANNDMAGLGAYHQFVNPYGFTRLGAELRRPDWQFVEGVLDDATRDRVFAAHRYSPVDRVILEGQVGLNQYNTTHGNNLSSTFTFQGSASYRLQETPYVAVAYNLDAEYELDEKNGRNSDGIITQRFPMDSREVHSLGVLASHNFSPDTNAEGYFSYGYERIDGDSGPAIEGRLTHYFDDNWGVQARAGYGFRGGANQGELAQGGLRLIYRY
jgi:tetratricopeptide (TPR) repeat protein